MILGIVGVVTGALMVVFYVAFICGVLALVFGLVVASRSRRAGLAVDGRARTAIVLGPIALVLSVVGAIVFFTVVRDVIDDLERVAPASSFELGEATCALADGTARFETQLTNTTDERDRFTLVAEFVGSGRTGRRIRSNRGGGRAAGRVGADGRHRAGRGRRRWTAGSTPCASGHPCSRAEGAWADTSWDQISGRAGRS